MTTYITMPKGDSGGYTGGPVKAVLHTTETWSDPRNWIGGWSSSSHEVWDYERDLVVRCVDLTLASKTLWNSAGGPQTNRDMAIQVELNGYAVNPADPLRPDYGDAKYRWIAAQWARLAEEVAQAGLGQIDFSDWRGDVTYGGSASEFADQRMGFQEWDDFNGICGHTNVPENDHWDPGLMNMGRLSQYILEARGTVAPAEPEQEPIEMAVQHITPNVRPSQVEFNGVWYDTVDFSNLGADATVTVCRKGDYAPGAFNVVLWDSRGPGSPPHGVKAVQWEPVLFAMSAYGHMGGRLTVMCDSRRDGRVPYLGPADQRHTSVDDLDIYAERVVPAA